jgi:hypothetical protein
VRASLYSIGGWYIYVLCLFSECLTPNSHVRPFTKGSSAPSLSAFERRFASESNRLAAVEHRITMIKLQQQNDSTATMRSPFSLSLRFQPHPPQLTRSFVTVFHTAFSFLRVNLSLCRSTPSAALLGASTGFHEAPLGDAFLRSSAGREDRLALDGQEIRGVLYGQNERRQVMGWPGEMGERRTSKGEGRGAPRIHPKVLRTSTSSKAGGEGRVKVLCQLKGSYRLQIVRQVRKRRRNERRSIVERSRASEGNLGLRTARVSVWKLYRATELAHLVSWLVLPML